MGLPRETQALLASAWGGDGGGGGGGGGVVVANTLSPPHCECHTSKTALSPKRTS